MFQQTWKKYLPVITLLMKRQAGTEQLLPMNHTDFERAAGGRKVKFTFPALELNNGKPGLGSKPTPLAADLVFVLQEDDTARMLMKTKDYVFSLKNDFQLLINIGEKQQLAAADSEKTVEQ